MKKNRIGSRPLSLLDPFPFSEKIGHLGVAGRLAVPRLNELRSDPNPFVRMWVAEALERITPPSN